MKSRILSVKVTLYPSRPHRHDAEIVRLWGQLRALVHERWREQMSAIRIGKKRPPEIRKQIAAGVEKAWADPEKRVRMAAQRKAAKRTLEWRENASKAQRASYERRRAAKGVTSDALEARIFGSQE